MGEWFEDLPLDFGRSETRAVVKLITDAYSTNDEALTLAQNIGLNLGNLNQAAKIDPLVRDMLNKAAKANLLGKLIDEVLADKDRAAFHDKLRSLIPDHEALGKLPSARPALRMVPRPGLVVDHVRTGSTVERPTVEPVSRHESWRELWPDVLSEIYDNPDDIRMVADDAQIRYSGIRSDQTPKTLWDRILTEADRQGKLDDLRNRVSRDHADLKQRLRPETIAYARPQRSPIEEPSTWSSPPASTEIRPPQPTSQAWRWQEPANSIQILSDLLVALRRLRDLTETYRDVVRRRSDAERFRLLTERLSDSEPTDPLRLRDQREAATVFDQLQDSLHDNLASQICTLRTDAKKYQTQLNKSLNIVNDMRHQIREARTVYIQAIELAGFWSRMQDHLHSEIRNLCTQTIELVDNMKRG